MTAIFGTISAIMIILQTVGVFVLGDALRLEGGTAFFLKLILIISGAVPYITLWIAAHNHDKLEEIEKTLGKINTNTTKPRENKTNTSVHSAPVPLAQGGKWTCKKCGEHNENTAMSCKNCGEYK